MVVVSNLGATHAAEKFLRPIRASAVEAVRYLVIDALHFEASMKIVPARGLIRVDDRSLCKA